jgi:ribosome maturation factor RimP
LKLTTRVPVNGKRHFVGSLESFQDGRITLKLDSQGNESRVAEGALERLEIELPNIEKANLIPEI